MTLLFIQQMAKHSIVRNELPLGELTVHLYKAVKQLMYGTNPGPLNIELAPDITSSAHEGNPNESPAVPDEPTSSEE